MASSSEISVKSLSAHVEETSLTLAQMQAQLQRSRDALSHTDGLHSPDARLQEGALYQLQQVLKHDMEKRCGELREGAPIGRVALADDHLRMLHEAYTGAVSMWKEALVHELGRVEDEMAGVDSMLMANVDDDDDDVGRAMSDGGVADDDAGSGMKRDEGSEWC
ncbi:uncharacterized protein MYCFIDRAFT_197817 [Pseudocercospora fijiensis CIRAD86]|uniref:Uncharacterized protein n=1 Tax=Pseudocercospora fijiensis (strain CIRAD86) TaxID=383855 RepID=M3ATY8_PSEFD|nr:uncharacterized protein MYCFIDRAFT_197817 [Pseudocercospora fijiensis CIRAD86]EME80957.1 hypothetical protein MYCFIDRAFT_197817 [Pseudocercospora fijiensis CIRAD86]